MKATLITIGEAPRKDIEDTFLYYFNGNDDVTQVGLLDGLSYDEALRQFGVQSKEEATLTSRFLNGEAIKMSHSRIEKALQFKVNALETTGVACIGILCTGSFESLSTQRALLLEAEKVTVPYVKKMFMDQRIGVIVPLPEQIREAKEKWQLKEAVFSHASPYAFSRKEFTSIAHEVASQGAEVIVLDCVGYSEKMKNVFIEETGLTVIQSNDVLFQHISEQIEEKYK